ncbi:MAG: hypothetical protein AAGA12_04625 [Pseudomonadota bacterium]
MAGPPLNYQLKDRGVRFLEAAATSQDHHLSALPGGPPVRPGLLRGEHGTSTELELWAMTTEQLGEFVASIPSPFCIGQVALSDRRAVSGFLVEHSGTFADQDITGYNGWRAFLDTSSASASCGSS